MTAGARDDPPFYILTPRYDRASAGVRILHDLATELERAGFEAFVCWTGPRGVDHADDAGFRHLTKALSLAHFKTRRTPVCIRPEVSHEAPAVGVDVVYVLNYPGLLGGPSEITADVVVAYSERLAAALPRCDTVVHLPACDPRFWTPGPAGRERSGACVYAGKYVEQHGGTIPPELAGARLIPRGGPDTPGPEQIREILRTSTHLYVFENTSMVTEALLCDCPVVVRHNPFFSEMIAAEEHGPWGLAEGDDPATLARARSELSRFRDTYLENFERGRRQLRDVADHACALARARTSSGPLPVPRRVEAVGPGRGRDVAAPADDLDIAFAYNLLLGREVESRAVFEALRGRALAEVLSGLLRSDEYAANASRILAGAAPRPALTVTGGLAALVAWIERRLPLGREARHGLRAAVNWPALHATVIADAGLAALLPGTEPASRTLVQRLTASSGRTDVRGHVDEQTAGRVSGWALDLNAPSEPVCISVWRGDHLLVETVTGGARPDVAVLAGGDGRSGFTLSAPELFAEGSGFVVRAGRDSVALPSSAPI